MNAATNFDDRPCFDCGQPTRPQDEPGEIYMVEDEVWQDSGAPKDAYLCIGCLEIRIGRTITLWDFTDAPVNHPMFGWKSDRLLDRFFSHGAACPCSEHGGAA